MEIAVLLKKPNISIRVNKMRKSIIGLLTAFTLSLWVGTANAALIVENFESFGDGTIITNQLTGLTVTAADGGDASIASASFPVVAGEPLGIYNTAGSIGFQSALIFDFLTLGSSIGAIVDFGGFGTGLQIVAYDGVGGTGNILGTASTLTEAFIGVNAVGIRSAVFSQAGQTNATWLLDNLTYDTDPGTRVPVPATLALFGLGLAGLSWSRRKKA